MKILFVLDNYHPFRGGAETLFRNLAEGLVKKGNSVTVLTRRIKGTRGKETISGVKVHRIRAVSRYLYSFLAIPAAARLSKKADIVHTTTFNSAFPAYVAARLNRKPAVITIHEVWKGKWNQYTDMDRQGAALHELLESPIYKLNFDKFICVSESTRKHLLGVMRNAKKTEVIYNGVDYGHFSPKKHNGKNIRKKLGLEGRFVCLTYGRAAPSKGMEYAAKAIRHVTIPNFKHVFLIAKDYNDRHRIIAQEVKKNKDRAALLEPVSYRELPDYIAAADCVVIPSLAEGFGYAAAEASAMGKIIVASNTTSLPEVVSGKYLLVQPRSAEAIAEGIMNAYRKKYTKTKQKRFTIEENVSAHEKLYSGILKRLRKV